MRRRFLLSIAISDLIALTLAVAAGSLVVFSTPLPWRAPSCGSTLTAVDCIPVGESIWPVLAIVYASAAVSIYASRRLWANGIPRPSYGRALAIVGFTLAITALGIVFMRPYFSRSLIAATGGIWLGSALLHRAVRRRRPWTERMTLVTGEKGLADDLRHAPHADVIAVFDPEGAAPSHPPETDTTLVVDLRAVLSDRMAQFVSSSNLAGYDVRGLVNVYEEHTGRIALVHLAEGWEISAPLSRNLGYAPFKRTFDILAVLATAPLWVPLALVIHLAVRIDSKGPAIYRQRRVGHRGRQFTLYKFRTMLNGSDAGAAKFAVKNDPRLTRVGRWLRRYRADEIPQLWNVLKGDLSLVGPRPEQVEFVRMFEETIPFYGYRHLVRPGVTGWAQVNYGYADDEADTVEKLTYDLYYVKHMSPWLDLRILGQSMWTVLSGFGAQ